MTLKQEFEKIIALYGHDVLLVHQDKTIPCVCYHPLTGSTDSNCPYCFGLGSVPMITKEKVRETDTNISSSLSTLSNNQSFGEMAVSGRAYYFKMDAILDTHDLILDVEWTGGQPEHVGRGLYEISHIDRKRFEHGAFVYQKVYTKEDVILRDIRAINIINRAGQTYYVFKEG